MKDRMLTLREACEVARISYSKGQRLAKANADVFTGIKKIGSTYAISLSRLHANLGMDVPPCTSAENDQKEVVYG